MLKTVCYMKTEYVKTSNEPMLKAVKGEDFLIETRGRERTMKKAAKIEKRGK